MDFVPKILVSKTFTLDRVIMLSAAGSRSFLAEKIRFPTLKLTNLEGKQNAKVHPIILNEPGILLHFFILFLFFLKWEETWGMLKGHTRGRFADGVCCCTVWPDINVTCWWPIFKGHRLDNGHTVNFSFFESFMHNEIDVLWPNTWSRLHYWSNTPICFNNKHL